VIAVIAARTWENRVELHHSTSRITIVGVWAIAAGSRLKTPVIRASLTLLGRLEGRPNHGKWVRRFG
jgi:hypothetical protein